MAYSVCLTCSNYTDFDEKIEKFTCLAYPDGIPLEIQSGKKEHDKVLKGQFDDFIYEYFDFDEK